MRRRSRVRFSPLGAGLGLLMLYATLLLPQPSKPKPPPEAPLGIFGLMAGSATAILDDHGRWWLTEPEVWHTLARQPFQAGAFPQICVAKVLAVLGWPVRIGTPRDDPAIGFDDVVWTLGADRVMQDCFPFGGSRET